MKLDLYEQRLIALARLHSKGLSSLASKLGHKQSNFSLIASGQRPMPERTRLALREILSFEECGFNDLRLESCLMRSLEDMQQLQAVGFVVTPITRLVSSRDIAARKDNSKRGAPYQFLVARLSFISSHRAIILRAAREIMDAFLKESFPDAEIQEAPFDYSKRKLLQDVLEIQKMGLTPSCERVELLPPITITETGRLKKQVESILDRDVRPVSPELSATDKRDNVANRLRRHRLYVEAIRKTFGISRTQNIGGHAFRKDGEKVEIEIHPVFVGERSEQVLFKEDQNSHLIVVLEHDNGVIEIIFEGPRQLIFENQAVIVLRPSTVRERQFGAPDELLGRIVTVNELRELNRLVPSRRRLMPSNGKTGKPEGTEIA